MKMIDIPEELKELSMREKSKSSITISKIVTMEGEYENVIFNGSKDDFIKIINDGEVIKIKDHEKGIYINSVYIVSFEF